MPYFMGSFLGERIWFSLLGKTLPYHPGVLGFKEWKSKSAVLVERQCRFVF